MSNLWLLLVIPMQTRVTDQPAYILHRRNWRNSSLILELFTLEYGCLSVMVKGAKQSKSAALYQPFYNLVISWSGRSELKTLVSIDGLPAPIESNHYLSLLYINELLTAFLPKQEANPEIFYLYRNLLNSVDSDFGEIQLREFERLLMNMLGYLPDISLDANSGRPFTSDQYYQFIVSKGFVLCDKNDANAIAGDTVIAWEKGQYDSERVLQLAKTIMRCIIDFNLHGKKLKSRSIYQQIKSRI